jgi:glutamyl-tRNA synthetase
VISFEGPTAYDAKSKQNWKEETTPLMQQLIMELEKIIDFTSLNIETIVKVDDNK